ncbi:MAG: SIMPL domain-containing protein [Rubrivivax sp.]
MTTRRLGAGALLLGAMLLPVAANSQTAAPQDVLSLSASASVEVTRDVLNLVLSTTREGPEPRAVQAELSKALEAALVEARKVAKPGQVDVSTGNFSLYPRQSPKGGGITHWQGTAELRVEGRDTQAISALVARITSLSVARISFGLSREAREQGEEQVAAEAIARFRSKADTYARHFGFKSVNVREVQIHGNDTMPPVMMMRDARAASASAEALPVEAGKATVTATVNGSVQMK